MTQLAPKINNCIFRFYSNNSKFLSHLFFLKLFFIFVGVFHIPPTQIQPKRDIRKAAKPKELQPKEFTTPNIDSKIDEKFDNLEKEMKEMSKEMHEMMKEINGLNKEMANIWKEIGNGKKKNADTNEWENDEK